MGHRPAWLWDSFSMNLPYHARRMEKESRRLVDSNLHRVGGGELLNEGHLRARRAAEGR